MLASRFFSAATASVVLVGFQRVYLMYLQHEWRGLRWSMPRRAGAPKVREHDDPVRQNSLQEGNS